MATIMDQIKRLADEQKRAWEVEGKPLADIAAERALTAEEREKFDRLNAEFDGYDERITVMRNQHDVEERAIQFADAIVSERGNDAEQADSLFRDVLSTGGFRDIVPTAAEVRSLSRYAGDLPPAVAAALRALTTGTATGGAGNTIGQTFLSELIEPLRQFSGVQAAGAYQFVTGSGDTVTLPRLASFGAAAAASEATQLGGTDPTFGQVTFGAFKYGDYRGVSNELIEDSLFDIDGLVTRLAGENIAVKLGEKLATGVGTTEPTGVATAATTGKTGATGVAGVPTWEDLIDLQESLLAPYHARAAWVASNGAVGAVRKMKDGTGRYLWEPNGQTGSPAELLGAPIHRDPWIDAPGLGKKSILFGDFSRYWVRIVGSVRVERSDHALFGTDQAAFRAVLRADGQLVDSSAIKAFAGGAS